MQRKGHSPEQVLNKLERENVRLKRTVADLALDKQILKEAAEGNF
jgi:hypothetical protein